MDARYFTRQIGLAPPMDTSAERGGIRATYPAPGLIK